MGAKSGSALKLLQLTLYAVLLASSALILGVYSYFLATLSNHSLPISTDVRAVEGISGSAVLYTALSILLVCCVAGLPAASLLAIVLDLAFAAAFIYVAVANKGGAGSCDGYVDTPFGKGKSGDIADSNDSGFTQLPSFHTACRLQTACLAVAIIAVFFFLFSLGIEFALIRHRRKEKRFGPSPANNYTSGYGKSGGGFFSRLLGRGKDGDDSAGAEENMLPKHTLPGDLGTTSNEMSENNPDSLNVGGTTYPYNPDYLPAANSKQETGYGYRFPQNNAAIGNAGYSSSSPYHQPNLPQDYRYDDGIYDRA